MSLRKFAIDDLDQCIDMYLDFANAFHHGEDPWTENAVAERLKGILESPVFLGWVYEEKGKVEGFILGVTVFVANGRGYDILELFCVPGSGVREAVARMLAQAAPLIKAEGYVRIGVLSNEFWTADFFSDHGFVENKDVRLFEYPL